MRTSSNFWVVRASVLAWLAVSPTLRSAELNPKSTWRHDPPIVTYYHGPGGAGGRWGPLTPGMAKKLADGGFTVAWGSTVKDLDVAHAHNLRVRFEVGDLMNTDAWDEPGRKAAIDTLIDRVKDHPAMYLYSLADEPSAKKFPMLGRIVAYLRQRDPRHAVHINLFPTYASANALGTSGDTIEAYRKHVQQFVDIVKPDLISYDHYNFRTTRDGGQYFLNLALVREAALRGGVPFMNVVQACSLSPTSRAPNGDESRFLAYTTLAYGGTGIAHFVYWPYSEFLGGISEYKDIEFNEERARADALAPLTPLGESLREIHPEFVAIARELLPLRSLGAFHLGVIPQGAVGPPPELPVRIHPSVACDETKGLLLGTFGAGHLPTHVLVVNLNYLRPVETTVIGPGPMETFTVAHGRWKPAPEGKRARIQLRAGGGALLRIQNTEDSK